MPILMDETLLWNKAYWYMKYIKIFSRFISISNTNNVISITEQLFVMLRGGYKLLLAIILRSIGVSIFFSPSLLTFIFIV